MTDLTIRNADEGGFCSKIAVSIDVKSILIRDPTKALLTNRFWKKSSTILSPNDWLTSLTAAAMCEFPSVNLRYLWTSRCDKFGIVPPTRTTAVYHKKFVHTTSYDLPENGSFERVLLGRIGTSV